MQKTESHNVALARLELAMYIHQVGLKLRNQPASASSMLGLKVCDTTPLYVCVCVCAHYKVINCSHTQLTKNYHI